MKKYQSELKPIVQLIDDLISQMEADNFDHRDRDQEKKVKNDYGYIKHELEELKNWIFEELNNFDDEFSGWWEQGLREIEKELLTKEKWEEFGVETGFNYEKWKEREIQNILEDRTGPLSFFVWVGEKIPAFKQCHRKLPVVEALIRRHYKYLNERELIEENLDLLWPNRHDDDFDDDAMGVTSFFRN